MHQRAPITCSAGTHLCTHLAPKRLGLHPGLDPSTDDLHLKLHLLASFAAVAPDMHPKKTDRGQSAIVGAHMVHVGASPGPAWVQGMSGPSRARKSPRMRPNCTDPS